MKRSCVDLFADGVSSASPVDAGRHRASFERAFLLGPPTEALVRWPAERDATPRHRWLAGAATGALGRYAEAFDALRPLADRRNTAPDPLADRRNTDAPTARTSDAASPYPSLAASTLASLHRQIGRHVDARVLDEAALRSAGGDPDAVFDALLGLAADAVGLGDADLARVRLRQTGPLVPAGPAGWRHRVRRGWVATEVALLTDDPVAAVAVADRALAEARTAGAPRHVVKCTLFAGVARLVADAGADGADGAEPADGGAGADGVRLVATARAGAVVLGTLPLRWVAESVLADVARRQGHRADAESWRRAAVTSVTAVADRLPGGYRDAWWERPDIFRIVRPND